MAALTMSSRDCKAEADPSRIRISAANWRTRSSSFTCGVDIADALTYALKYKPQLIIDVATLTGAAMAALGQRASALFTNNLRIERELRESGEITGDFVWPLPLWEEYEKKEKPT